MSDTAELKKVLNIRNAMQEYQDSVYMNLIRQLNDDYEELTTENWGMEFVKNCARDLAGEVVRNFFNTSDYYISVDQLAKRILNFSYDDEYDPLTQNGSVEMIRKNVYSNNEVKSSRIDEISKLLADSQKKLFTEERSKDKLDREKKSWRESKKDENGDLYDDLTGEKGEKTTVVRNGKEEEKSRLQADHVQSREAAMYNSRYISEDGAQRLREFYNSDDNFQMMLDSANSSKGDVRVYDKDGNDITYKATPEQLADAICDNWEKETPSGKKIEELKKHGYLDENGKVTKSVRRELVRNIRRSQIAESKVILKNTDYKKVAGDAGLFAAKSLWKIVAGQVIYYVAPPVIYEIKVMSRNKNLTIDQAIERLQKSIKRIGDYVYAHIKEMVVNISENTLKTFIKSFLDILIGMVKSVVKRLLQSAKSLVLSTVDAIRILMDKNTDSTQKADAVFNLYSITITSCAMDALFGYIAYKTNLPDWLLTSLQIVATVIVTNFTMLILKKLDLFDVNYGFKIAQIRNLFEETNKEYEEQYELAQQAADYSIDEIINMARHECISIYDNLEEMDMKKSSAREDLEKINQLFSVGISFEEDWLRFLGVSNGY